MDTSVFSHMHTFMKLSRKLQVKWIVVRVSLLSVTTNTHRSSGVVYFIPVRLYRIFFWTREALLFDVGVVIHRYSVLTRLLPKSLYQQILLNIEATIFSTRFPFPTVTCSYLVSDSVGYNQLDSRQPFL